MGTLPNTYFVEKTLQFRFVKSLPAVDDLRSRKEHLSFFRFWGTIE